MFDRIEFEKDKIEKAKSQSQDDGLKKLALEFIVESDKYDYGYQWTWLGLPIIQMPQDIIAIQEIIWKTKPDVIIETGIAWGGSVVYYASLLDLIGKGKMVAVDTVLPQKNIDAIMKYPFSSRIHLHKGSSTDPETLDFIKGLISGSETVMVILDANHTHDHVLEELRLYAPLVTKGQYLVVFATILEDIPRQKHRVRSWGPGNNPKTALRQYLQETDRFSEDEYVSNKLISTFAINGYLECVK